MLKWALGNAKAKVGGKSKSEADAIVLSSAPSSKLPETLRGHFVNNGGASQTGLKKSSTFDLESFGEVLGQGNYGTVKLRVDRNTGESRAVKVVLKPDHWDRARLVHEAEVMKNLDHPYILRLFGWHDEETSMTMVTEFCAGGELINAVRKATNSWTNAVHQGWAAMVFRQLFEAMNYCHDRGLVHRDIKGGNILLYRAPESETALFKTRPHVVVADLGLATIINLKDQAKAGGGFNFGRNKKAPEQKGAGTTAMMAPEVWKGTSGPKSDMWSLGCVLYQVFTAQLPFMPADPEDDTQATWAKLYKEDTDWILMLHASSEEARDLCRELLTVDVRLRPAAKECLRNSWFSRFLTSCPQAEPGASIDWQTLAQTIVHWPLTTNLQKALRLKMAGLSSGTIKFAEVFTKMDTDSNGVLTSEEFIETLGMMKVNETIASKIADALDYNGDGFVEFLEFAAAALPALCEEYDRMVWQEFCQLDTAGKGWLNFSMYNKLLEAVRPVGLPRAARGTDGHVEVVLHPTFEEMDLDRDGKISFSEFLNAFGRPGVDYSTWIKEVQVEKVEQDQAQAREVAEVKAKAEAAIAALGGGNGNVGNVAANAAGQQRGSVSNTSSPRTSKPPRRVSSAVNGRKSTRPKDKASPYADAGGSDQRPAIPIKESVAEPNSPPPDVAGSRAHSGEAATRTEKPRALPEEPAPAQLPEEALPPPRGPVPPREPTPVPLSEAKTVSMPTPMPMPSQNPPAAHRADTTVPRQERMPLPPPKPTVAPPQKPTLAVAPEPTAAPPEPPPEPRPRLVSPVLPMEGQVEAPPWMPSSARPDFEYRKERLMKSLTAEVPVPPAVGDAIPSADEEEAPLVQNLSAEPPIQEVPMPAAELMPLPSGNLRVPSPLMMTQQVSAAACPQESEALLDHTGQGFGWTDEERVSMKPANSRTASANGSCAGSIGSVSEERGEPEFSMSGSDDVSKVDRELSDMASGSDLDKDQDGLSALVPAPRPKQAKPKTAASKQSTSGAQKGAPGSKAKSPDPNKRASGVEDGAKVENRLKPENGTKPKARAKSTRAPLSEDGKENQAKASRGSMVTHNGDVTDLKVRGSMITNMGERAEEPPAKPTKATAKAKGAPKAKAAAQKQVDEPPSPATQEFVKKEKPQCRYNAEDNQTALQTALSKLTELDKRYEAETTNKSFGKKEETAKKEKKGGGLFGRLKSVAASAAASASSSSKKSGYESFSTLLSSMGHLSNRNSNVEVRPIIVFDWDDTITSTYHIQTVVLANLPQHLKDMQVTRAYHEFPQFQRHACVAEAVLRSAKSFAHVSILTLCEPAWLQASMERYFPEVDVPSLLSSLDIQAYHADRESAPVKAQAAMGADPSLVAKKVMFSRCLRDFYGTDAVRWNVMSIGDSNVEHDALKAVIQQEALSDNSRICGSPLCKTVKFPDNPSLTELTANLREFMPCIQAMVDCDRSFHHIL